MELRDLKYFCTAAELGSVTKAASMLGVSQPFVTKVIGQLEREVGTQLFDIQNRHISLNNYGEAFYHSAKEIVSQADALMTKMDEMLGRTENTVTFLYNNSGYLEPIVAAYHEAFPERSVSLTFSFRQDIIDALNTNQADFALTLPPITGEESKMIETINVFQDSGSVLLPPGSPLLEKDYITLEDLSSLSFIISHKGCGIRDVMDQGFERYGIHPKIVYETDDFGLQISMVRKGMGAAVCSVAHRDDPNIGSLCRRMKINQGFGGVGISYNKYRHMTPAMIEFRQFIVAFFNKMKEAYYE